MEVGVDSFAAALTETSIAVSQADRMRDLLEEIEHADQVGLDVFGVGEHHRKEFLDSAPAVILAAAAARTKRIRLTSAVAVLSAADLAGGWRDTGVVRARWRARASVDGRDHRRRDAALPAARGALSGGRPASGLLTRSIESRCPQPWLRRRDGTTGRRRLLPRVR